MQHSPDFLPIPRCFSHLVRASDDCDPGMFRVSRRNSNGDCVTISVPIPGYSGTPGLDKIDSVDESDDCLDRLSDSNVQQCQNTVENSVPPVPVPCSGHPKQPLSDVHEEDEHNNAGHESPFLRLNSSLRTLQREMKDLRHLDISLFCQLLSLNEAIQDFKMNISDRYSETGSEYSLGTASYMGSMSSLNDESDWGEDGAFPYSPVDHQDGSEAGENTDENSTSASSLLKQITDLALRADQDF